jgi:uncharacterized lipoprotein YajG
MTTKPVALVVGLLVLAACGSGDESTDTTPATPATVVESTATTVAPNDTATPTTMVDDTVRISVTVGVDSGPDRIEEVAVGDSIELTMVNPDEDDEFHVHGFDLGGDETPAGEEKVFVFTATESGDFEVESHATGDVLVVIRVS